MGAAGKPRLKRRLTVPGVLGKPGQSNVVTILLSAEKGGGQGKPIEAGEQRPQAQMSPQPTPEPSGGILSRGKGPGAALPCVDTDAHGLPLAHRGLASPQVSPVPGLRGSSSRALVACVLCWPGGQI